ncbi:DUF3370 domain-containing protein [Leptolyngbyaceae cyanobacterium CCMR0082]|uniref:DUF3370 domain-containing protein n=2 Tax=Adonisia turfae TaxID=2950184 RepID=A0A6M0SDE4_9CYAN|nr:DUF3370 domain-containing protein [Adonisia turfae]NEZ58330.1 DUF3370 domain-containing protein [Adonisia turfae CCMR0081]NEZ66510.1 DUF3370 domain-containing protein [Adonisia turfae CCMR0082]
MFFPLIAQAPSPPQIVRPQEVRPLPAQLDTLPVFNSNSPELIGEPGILLSTFPPEGMEHPEAHLDFAFEGRFDVFAHHVYRADDPEDLRPMYVALLVHNPGVETVTVNVLAGASYLSQPDAPFITLPSAIRFSPRNPVFAGPGSRVMGDLIQGRRQDLIPSQLVVPPGANALLLNAPIPVAEFDPPINGRSTLIELDSSGPVYLASLSETANVDGNDHETAPTLAQWASIVKNSGLAGPRDRTPTPITDNSGQVIYGRVAGVAQGSSWTATVTDDGADVLTIPASNTAISYGLSTLHAGQMGTNQNQSAPMLVRYGDTAYQAHGNYGVEYTLAFPLQNSTDSHQTVTIALETPIKEDTLSTAGLQFFETPPNRTFFRGPVQVRYRDDDNLPRIRNFHLVQLRGQQAEPLTTLTLAPQEKRRVDIILRYPPDATPPQVITIQTE